MSSSSASESEAEGATENRGNSSLLVQPVLKATGRQTGNGTLYLRPETQKSDLGEQIIKRDESQFNSKDQFALKVSNDQKPREGKYSQLNKPCQINNLNVAPCVVEDNGSRDIRKQVAVISPVRPRRAKKLRLELTRLDAASHTPEADPVKTSKEIQRIPTVEWMSRKTKDLVEKAVGNSQSCNLCTYQTSKLRISIHVRQHYCINFCQCGYQHTSHDQVAEHQKTTRRAGYSRAQCRVFMVAEEQFPAFRQD